MPHSHGAICAQARIGPMPDEMHRASQWRRRASSVTRVKQNAIICALVTNGRSMTLSEKYCEASPSVVALGLCWSVTPCDSGSE